MGFYFDVNSITPSKGGSGGGGGGDSPTKIEAINNTGANISEGDKVWVNSYYYEAGTAHSFITSSSYKSLITANGNYVIHNGNLYSINGTNLGSTTINSSQELAIFDCPDGVTYIGSTSGMQRIDAGLGWSNTNFMPIVGTSEYVLQKTNSYVSEKIVKINPNTGEVIKTYNKPSGFTYLLSYNVRRICYLGNNKFWAAYSNSSSAVNPSGGYILTLDDVNNTWTYISTTTPSDLIIGVTSDYKYILMITNHIYDVATMTDVYSALNFPCTIDSYTYFDAKENICQRHNGAASSATGGNYKVVKYNPETQTWQQISIDYSTIMGSTSGSFYRACFENGEFTKAFYSNNYNHYWKPMVSQGGYNLVKYGLETTNQTLTGFAEENINSGSTGEISITLPPQINVSFTVDANDATIITE